LRRWRDRRSVSSEAIEIVSGISLGSKERIVLLRIGTEQVLVGVSPAGMRRLHVVKPNRSLKQLEVVTAHSELDSEADNDRTVSKKPVTAAFDLSMGTAQ
jgi:flagellar biogenesis protein FliO